MHDLDRVVGGNAVTGEVLDTEDYIVAVYDRLGLEGALDAYLDQPQGHESDVTNRLAQFSDCLAEAATRQGGMDTAVVRAGVDHLTDSMNEVCSARFGYKRPRSLPQAVRAHLARTCET